MGNVSPLFLQLRFLDANLCSLLRADKIIRIINHGSPMSSMIWLPIDLLLLLPAWNHQK